MREDEAAMKESSSENDFIYLDRNENLFGPAPACTEVLRRIRADELWSYSREFLRGVKSRLSERLAEEHGLAESQILLSDGSEDMLKQIVHCYLGVGDVMLCPAQSWWYYQAVASEVGGKTETFPLVEHTDMFAYDVSMIEQVYHQCRPRILLLASPNNPTGNSLRHDSLEEILRFTRRSIVVLDEAYWGFAEQQREVAFRLVQENPHLIVIRSFSKLFALAGARIAYAVVGEQFGTLTKFAARYLGYNRLSEHLALAALDSMGYYRAVGSTVRAERERLYQFFNTLEGYRCYRSDANFVLVRVPRDEYGALEQYLKSEGILVKFFSGDEVGLFHCMRITVGRPPQNDRLMRAIEAFVATGRNVSA